MKLRWEDMVNRSTVTLAALVLLLGVLLAARAMNPQQAQTAMREINTQITPQPAAKDVSQGDFFKDFRQQREQARADEVALLDGIVNRADTVEELEDLGAIVPVTPEIIVPVGASLGDGLRKVARQHGDAVLHRISLP